jgi:hypothetical protein
MDLLNVIVIFNMTPQMLQLFVHLNQQITAALSKIRKICIVSKEVQRKV